MPYKKVEDLMKYEFDKGVIQQLTKEVMSNVEIQLTEFEKKLQCQFREIKASLKLIADNIKPPKVRINSVKDLD